MAHFFATTIPLPEGLEKASEILALGGELKSSICLLSDGQAHLSKIIGDLEEEAVYRHFLEQVDAVFNHMKPTQLVIDKHPDYQSSQLGHQRAHTDNIKLTQVQHHHAHIAAVMADNQYPLNSKPVLGFALDGLGFGDDGTIWGGEILLSNYQDFKRVASFKPVPMIGGAAAIHEPWRNTLAHLLPIWGQVKENFADTDIIQFLNTKPTSVLKTMVDKGVNAPLTSSCGRLFDAVAAALGLHREHVEFEAQAAIHLEALASSCFEQETEPYSFDIIGNKNILQIGWQAMWLEILKDIQEGQKTERIASRFHHTLIHALSGVATTFKEIHDFGHVALSGGVFQNQLISTHLPIALKKSGFKVLQHQKIPSHDGGLAIGQAIIAAARSI
ncbi:MAG: hypothetical protein L3J70_01760 [Gammaproteobacteria bacterium]|nr:hypothetical protein [Gammaproteobacteria bacterium]